MAKTEETIELEDALDAYSEKTGRYGCREVTIGFKPQGHGDEIVDYMSMDSAGVFRCYEIKVTLSDLKSENKKSWYGSYNYLVAGKSLWLKVSDWDEFIPPWTGILVGNDLRVRRNAKKRTCSDREMLMESLLRSIYWKMCEYRRSSDPASMRALEKQLNETEAQYEALRQQSGRTAWTYKDLEHYYRLNHQDDSFTVDAFAKRQRKEYAMRRDNEMSWVETDGGLLCPVCGKRAPGDQRSDYCPWCGSDLRKIKG